MTARMKPVRKEATQEVTNQWNALRQQQDSLREEIKRGTECLRQAQSDLAERRARLENWTTYERHCGVDCLGHLTELVSSNERVTRFLNAWVERRTVELAGVERTLAGLAGRHGMVRATGSDPRSTGQPAKVSSTRRLFPAAATLGAMQTLRGNFGEANRPRAAAA